MRVLIVLIYLSLEIWAITFITRFVLICFRNISPILPSSITWLDNQDEMLAVRTFWKTRCEKNARLQNISARQGGKHLPILLGEKNIQKSLKPLCPTLQKGHNTRKKKGTSMLKNENISKSPPIHVILNPCHPFGTFCIYYLSLI